MFARRLTRLLLPLALAAPAHAQIAMVAHTSSTTGGATPAINTTGANMIAVCGQRGTTITDNQGNSYAKVYDVVGGYAATDPVLYAAFQPTTSATHTISSSGTTPFSVTAFSGVASGPDKTVESSSVNAYPLPIGPITPTNANELIYGCFMGNFPGVSAPSASFSGMTNNTPTGLVAGGNQGTSDAYLIQTTAASFSTNVTMNQSNGADGYLASFYSVLTPGTLTVSAAVPLPEAFLSTAYNYCPVINAGVKPYTVTLSTGTLPAGLSMSSTTGCITGTPTSAILATPLTFRVTDVQSHVATSNATRLTVATSPVTMSTSACTLTGKQLTAYAGCTITASGGTGPYTFTWDTSINYQSLPEGMTLASSSGAITGSRLNAQGVYTTLFYATDAQGGGGQESLTFSIDGDNTFGGNPLGPADSWMYMDVSTLPKDTSWLGRTLNAYDGQVFLKPLFGSDPGGDGGIPINTILPNQPFVKEKVQFGGNNFLTGPIPCNAAVEGTINNADKINGGRDTHMMGYYMAGVGADGKQHPAALYESYNTYPNADCSWGDGLNGPTDAGGYGNSVFSPPPTNPPDLLSNYNLPQPGATTDAAGLPITPLLLNADDIIGTGTAAAPNGSVKRPIRVTFSASLRGHVWPATADAGYGGSGTLYGGYFDPQNNHQNQRLDPPTQCQVNGATVACDLSGQSQNPMGLWLRVPLNATEPAGCSSNPIMHKIWVGLQHHGVILADNGSTGYAIGTPDARWPSYAVTNGCLGAIKISTLEPVNPEVAAVNWLTSTKVSTTYSVAAPTFQPVGFAYATAQNVTLVTGTTGATIYYTTDGSMPTTSSAVYSTPIPVAANMTINAIAVKAGQPNSTLASNTYQIGSTPLPAQPTIAPLYGGATSASPITVTLTGTSPIYYTTNNTPVSTGANLYTAPFTVSTSSTIRAASIVSGVVGPYVGNAYTITGPVTASPTFSPAGGTYSSTQTVTLSSATSGATIYYTLDGTTPTTASAVYSAPLTISATTTVTAIAAASGYSQSAASSATYTIQTAAKAATPTFTQAGSPPSVSIADATPGATIYYTLDGSTPTTASTVYTAPISITTTTTINAIATAPGYTQSAVGNVTVSVTAVPAPTFSPAPPASGVSVPPQTVSIADAQPTAAIYYTTNGTTPTASSTRYAAPLSISNTTTLKAIAILNGTSSLVTTGVYTITPPSIPSAGLTFRGSFTLTCGNGVCTIK